MNKKKHHIYMDHASATPISKKVYASMKPYVSDLFYNPSALYKGAYKVRKDIEETRSNIANMLGTQSSLIYFLDGATEANNVAILGIVRSWQKQNPHQRPHIITTTIEHASVLSVFRELESVADVTYLEVDKEGNIDANHLKKSLRENTILISVGYVNGEIGVIQDLKAIMKVVRHQRKHSQSNYPYVHSDVVQAINYCSEIALNKLGIDLMVMNAAKIYGPKKIAVLALRSYIDLEPIIFGGNQEMGLRAGTENTPAIIGIGRALEETRILHEKESSRLRDLSEYFTLELQKLFSEIILNSTSKGSPHIVNISFPDISHEEVMLRLDAEGIMCSVKSACKSGEEGDSHVIMAIRKDGNLPTGSLRFSLGRTTRRSDIKKTLSVLKTTIPKMIETHKKFY